MKAVTALFKAVHWLLLADAVILTITGAGITNYRIVTRLTFGVLGKAASFNWHLALWIPFLVLLALHMIYTLYLRKRIAIGANKGKGRTI